MKNGFASSYGSYGQAILVSNQMNNQQHSTSSSLATSPVFESQSLLSSTSLSQQDERSSSSVISLSAPQLMEDDDSDQFFDETIGISKRHPKLINQIEKQTNSSESTASKLSTKNSQQLVSPPSWTVKLQVSESASYKPSNKKISNVQQTTLIPETKELVKIKTPLPQAIERQLSNNQIPNEQSSDGNYTYVSMKHADMSFPVFRELWEQKQVCDVILKLCGRQFPAHRVVLCATIPYFHAMFTNDLVERNQVEIELKTDNGDHHSGGGKPSLDVEAFESLLQYAYTGTIAINSKNVQSILIGASFLGLENVQQACSDYLKIRLNISNVLNVKTFAFALGCDTLVQASKRFIHRNFEEISKSDDFSYLDFEELLDMIGSDELNISNEKIVFEAVMKWIKHDEEMRQQYLPQLLRQVRLPLLHPEYLTDVVLEQKLVRHSLECRDLVDEAKDFHLLPYRRDIIPHSRTRPRSGHYVQGSIYAVGGLTKTGDSMSTVEVYDPQIKRWRMAEAMKMMKLRVGVVVMDGKLYAIGGYNGFDRLNTVEVYDSKLKQWKRVKSMHFRRSAVGAAALNGYLYVCGGYDGSASLNVVERYLASTDEWTNVTPMNIKRSASGVVALDGYIYALGGHDGLMIFNSVERYDPQTDQWEFVEPMLSRRCRLGVAAFGGKIYVCGGYDGCTFLQTAEVFDPLTNKWSYLAKMHATRSRVALVANCAKLFAIGGHDGVTNLSSVETYDIENDCWEMAASMVAHEGGVGVGVIPDNY